MAAKKNTPTTSPDIVEIITVTQGHLGLGILGTTPLVLNRLSEKTKHELLLPAGRKTALQKSISLKHSPIDEYRASAHRFSDPNTSTYLGILSTAFKGAMKTAALDLPGAKKAQIGRLVYVDGDYAEIYGVPQLFMRPVRSADMNKTPDIRTRAIIPKWACQLSISFVEPLIRAQAVANLMAAAGFTAGVGDGRPEKGALNYGQFSVVPVDDPRFQEIVATGGRAAQVEAIENPECYDDESAELLSWFHDELKRRQLKGVA
jgi:hypothetical protein